MALIVKRRKRLQRVAQSGYRVIMRNRFQMLIGYFWTWGIHYASIFGVEAFMFGVFAGVIIGLLVASALSFSAACLYYTFKNITGKDTTDINRYLTEPLDLSIIEIEVPPLDHRFGP